MSSPFFCIVPCCIVPCCIVPCCMAPIPANVSVVLFCSVGFVVAWVGQVGAVFSVGFGAVEVASPFAQLRYS
ncbi:MAG: hypothetical protein WA984_10895 [Phormidesmis sp.]